MTKYAIMLSGVFVMLLWTMISLKILQSSESFYLLFISCFWAPIWEEIRFRWAPITIGRIIDEKLVWPVAIYFSFSFGMEHGNLQEGTFIQGIHGLILSYIYIKTKKIWYSILAHSGYNIIIYMAQ